MIQVRDILPEARKIVGNDDEVFLFDRITDAVELLANKGDFDPLIGCLDIGVHNQMVTLPPEVEVPLGMNICGRPALARDQLFRFHLNGKGDRKFHINYEWENLGDYCTYRELPCPSKLIAYCSKPQDAGKEFWVEGMDQNGEIIRTQVGDEWRDGWPVPVVYSFTALPTDAPIYSRITRIRKADDFIGASRLSTLDLSTNTGVLLGVYQYNQTDPMLRRIRLSHNVPWIRISFRRSVFKITNENDYIPLGNKQAVLMMMRALRSYDSAGGIAEAEAQEATAVRWLSEEQQTSAPAVVSPIQVHNTVDNLIEKRDYVD